MKAKRQEIYCDDWNLSEGLVEIEFKFHLLRS